MAKLLYAGVSYVVFLAAFVWAVAFVGDLPLAPRTLDSGLAPPLWQALAVDALLLGVFAVQHSVMARPAFKRAWTRVVPPAIERSTYVLAASLVLLLLFWRWEPMPGVVWDVQAPLPRAALFALYAAGWLIVLASTFMISHTDLFGLRQAWAGMNRRALDGPRFRRVLLYRVVRHPIMLGFLVAFWATPTMTVGHLVFALATTGYILVGVRLEERDLVATLGDEYARYRREVRGLLPIPRGARPADPGADVAMIGPAVTGRRP
jgi:protein-S-isoprenylcysteine O-methyltransferase Ste14